MQKISAKKVPFTLLKTSETEVAPFPYLRDSSGAENMVCISPHHGRSFIVSKEDERFIVSKGNGLSYTQYTYLYSGEFDENTWGILLEDDAIRDFEVGKEIRDLGIKTNIMQYVIKLEHEIRLIDGHTLFPVLLQYSVECPYRICDFPYMDKNEVYKEVEKWEKYNAKGYRQSSLIAAEVLVNNLRILHSNQILHNAIHPQNYTWALELLDFEISHSPKYPYTQTEYLDVVKKLFPREIIQTYDVINHIAASLGETINHAELEELFWQHGFDIKTVVVYTRISFTEFFYKSYLVNRDSSSYSRFIFCLWVCLYTQNTSSKMN